MNEHHIVLSIVTVAGLGVGAQWLAWRLNLPAIVLFAAVDDFCRDRPEAGVEELIMNEDKDVDFCSAQRASEPQAGDTIVCFAPAGKPSSSETADAPRG